VNTAVVEYSWRDALRSRWSTSPLMWLVAAPVQICGIVIRNSPLHPDHVAALVVLAVIAELAVLLLLMLVARQRSSRARLQSMTSGEVLIVWAGCGVLLTLIMELGVDLLIGGGGLGPGARLLWTTGSTFALFGGATMVGAGVVERQADIVRLRRANDRIMQLGAASQRFAEDQRLLLADALDAMVIPVLEQLAEEAEELNRASQSDLEPLQARVAFYSETIVRSLSREVSGITPQWPEPMPAKEPGIGFTVRGLLDLLMAARVRILPSAAFMGVVLWTQVVPSCLPRDALALASCTIVAAIGHLMCRLVSTCSLRGAGFVNILVYPAIGASFAWSARTPIVACEWEGSNPQLLAAVSIGVTCLALISMAFEVSGRSRADASKLASRSRVGEAMAAELDRAGERLRDQVSLVLHGSVQSRLTAVALALRVHMDEVRAGGHPDQRQLLVRVTVLLELAVADVQSVFAEEPPPASLETRMKALRGQWLGLLDITWGESPRAAEVLGADPECAAWVFEILGEAITNASRHGKAGSVHLRIDVDHETGTMLVISATDDGIGPPADLREGLGTERVRARGGSWVLESRIEGGSRMTVTLPIPSERGVSLQGDER
jgi:signal transduction histidine kinase